jgi:hypothetical protein
MILTLILAGCDPLLPDAGVGVSLEEGGQIRIHLALCPGEMVSRIALVTTRDNVVGNEDDLVLWEIRPTADGGNEGRGFRVLEALVGVDPDGFDETVALTEPIPRRDQLDIFKDTSQTEQIASFEVAELSIGSILSEDEMWSEAEFVSRARQECERRAQG